MRTIAASIHQCPHPQPPQLSHRRIRSKSPPPPRPLRIPVDLIASAPPHASGKLPGATTKRDAPRDPPQTHSRSHKERSATYAHPSPTSRRPPLHGADAETAHSPRTTTQKLHPHEPTRHTSSQSESASQNHRTHPYSDRPPEAPQSSAHLEHSPKPQSTHPHVNGPPHPQPDPQYSSAPTPASEPREPSFRATPCSSASESQGNRQVPPSRHPSFVQPAAHAAPPEDKSHAPSGTR